MKPEDLRILRRIYDDGIDQAFDALHRKLADMHRRNDAGALDYRDAPVMYGNGYEAACDEIRQWIEDQDA